jgi:hypothetical protein
MGVAGGLGVEGEISVEAGDTGSGSAGVADRDGVGDVGGDGELGAVAGGGEGSVVGVTGEGDAGGRGEQERGDSCKSPSSPSTRNSSTSKVSSKP